MAVSKFVSNVVGGDSQFGHKHHNVIAEVGNFINRLIPAVFASYNYLGGFLADFFRILSSPFRTDRWCRSLPWGFPSGPVLIYTNPQGKTGFPLDLLKKQLYFPGGSGRPFWDYVDKEGVHIAVCSNRYYFLIIP